MLGLRPFGALSVLLAMTGACRESDPGPSDPAGDDDPVPFLSATAGDTGDATGTGDTGGDGVPGEASDLCAAASSIGEGKHVGTLRGRQSDLEGACGEGGPDAFFRLDVPRRSDVWLRGEGAGFVPRIGVLSHGCAADWARGMACTEGIGTWIVDVPAGASLLVSIGADENDPALQMPVPEEGADPLDFALEVKLRDVLEPGEVCEPATRGRCGAGTACLPSPSGSGSPECTVLFADTCATAAPLDLPFGATTIEIPAAAIHSDAHAHACGGARRPERVLALSVPISNDLPTLTASTDHPGVGLALRGRDCDPAGELACDAAAELGARIEADLPLEIGRPVLLFVELPAVDADDPDGIDSETEGEEAPIVVHLELTTPG